MAEFINTIDVLGDDAVIDSIINRTITSFEDDKITTIGDFVFYGCSQLTKVVCPSVTKIGSNVFTNCTQLSHVEFHNITSSIGSVGFNSGCSSLCTVILRGTTIPSLGNTAFNNTPIASGTGYIYVPRALIDQYKAATNWSAYASQFRVLEDYTDDGTTTGEFVIP